MPKFRTTTKLALAFAASLMMSSTSIAATMSGTENITVDKPFSKVVTQYPGVDVSYAIKSGNLPNGLVLNAATGEISGVPIETGDFSITVNTFEGGLLRSSIPYKFWVIPEQYIRLSPDKFSKAGDEITVDFNIPFSTKTSINSTNGDALVTTFSSLSDTDIMCLYRVTSLACQYIRIVQASETSQSQIRIETPRGSFKVTHNTGIFSDFRSASVNAVAAYSAPPPSFNVMLGQRLELTSGDQVNLKLGWHPMMSGTGIPEGRFTLAPKEYHLLNNTWSGNLPAGLSLASDGQLTGTLTESPVGEYIFYLLGDTQTAGQPPFLMPFIVKINAPAPEAGNGNNGGNSGRPKFVFRMTTSTVSASF